MHNPTSRSKSSSYPTDFHIQLVEPSNHRERAPKQRPKPKGNRNPRFVMVWPKDPRPGNPSHWPWWWRWKDVLTGRGPDIYVERIRPKSSRVNGSRNSYSTDHSRCGRDHGDECKRMRSDLGDRSPSRSPSRLSSGSGGEWRGMYRKPGWTLWHKDHLKWCRKPCCDECRRIRLQEEKDNFFRGARRHPEERYDFRTRRYAVPDAGTWSGKVHCDDPLHAVPRRYWDRYGRAYPADLYHDLIEGAHEDERESRDRCRVGDHFG
ncbi:hypothetical protein BDW72DRAFT_197729 [Aspergillus terricola var. indicus]